MTSAKARLIISGALFLLWLSFLFYLVLHSQKSRHCSAAVHDRP